MLHGIRRSQCGWTPVSVRVGGRKGEGGKRPEGQGLSSHGKELGFLTVGKGQKFKQKGPIPFANSPSGSPVKN